MDTIDVVHRGRELTLVHDFSFGGYAGRCHVTVPVGETGTPVLFLSGAFQGPRSLRSAIEHFGEYCVTLMVETPGSVGDEVLPAEFGFDWLAASIVSVLDEMRVDRVNVVAASYATPAAICLAALHPDRVDRVALAGAAAGFDGEVRERVVRSIELLRQGDQHGFAELVCRSVVNTDPDLDIKRRRQVLGLMRRQLRTLSDVENTRYCENSQRVLDAPQRLAALDPVPGPVLLFTGEHDLLTPPESGRRLLRRFPEGVFTLVRNTDHLFFLEDPVTAIELAARFFDGSLEGPLETSTGLEYSRAPVVIDLTDRPVDRNGGDSTVAVDRGTQHSVNTTG